MSKGNKQHGSREAKKPKARKPAVPAPATFLKPQPDPNKPATKTPTK
jgi:hypothetical protein